MQEKPENDPNNPDDFDDEFLDEFGDEFADEDTTADELAAYDAGEAESLSEDELAYLDDEFLDDDEWEDDEDDAGPAPIAPGAGAQKERKKGGADLSFNTKVIIGAVVVGVGVLVWQVMTKKPQFVESFATALSMTGATDGPIFGERPSSEEPTPPAPNMDEGPGLLGDTPPMPAPVTPSEEMSPEEQQASMQPQGPLTPMPDDAPVPRSPEETPPPPTYSIDARTGDEQPNQAADMLKAAMAAREQQQTPAEEPLAAAPPTIDAFGEETSAPAPVLEPAPALVAEAPPPAPTSVETPAPSNTAAAQIPGDINQKFDQIMQGFITMSTRMDEINTNSNNQISALRDELKNELTSVRAEVKAAPAPTSSGDGAANAQTAQQIENVRQEMQQALAQIQEEIKKAPAPAPSAAPASGVSEAQLNDMRQEMQSQFAQMRQEMKAEIEKSAAANTPTQTQVVVPVPAAPKAQTQPKAESKPAPQQQATAPKQAAPKKAASAGGAWQLKAAKPGKAWVSRAGSNNIQGVSVGDNLDGIGRVTAISFVSGRWVVQGTAGSIRQ